MLLAARCDRDLWLATPTATHRRQALAQLCPLFVLGAHNVFKQAKSMTQSMQVSICAGGQWLQRRRSEAARSGD